MEESSLQLAGNGLAATVGSWTRRVSVWIRVISNSDFIVVSLSGAAVSPAVDNHSVNVGGGIQIDGPPLLKVGESDGKPIGVFNIIQIKASGRYSIVGFEGSMSWVVVSALEGIFPVQNVASCGGETHGTVGIDEAFLGAA